MKDLVIAGLLIGALALAAWPYVRDRFSSPLAERMENDYSAYQNRFLNGAAAYEFKTPPDGGGVDFAEVKRLLEDQQKAWSAFKTANDDELAALKKKLSDPIAADVVKKINEALDKLGDGIKAATSRADEIEKKLNRPGALGGTQTPEEAKAELKALEKHNIHLRAYAAEKSLPQPALLTIEQFRAGKAAFVKAIRYGERALNNEEEAALKAMSVGNDPDGGYLVPADLAGRMVTKAFDTSPIRQIADVQPTSRDALEGIEDVGEAGAGWVAEMGTRTDSTNPQIGRWRIPVMEQYAMPKATQQLLDDSEVDAEAWLVNKVGDKFGRVENTAFVVGSGVGQPRGFTSYPVAALADSTRTWGTMEYIVTGTNGSLGVGTAAIDKLIDVQTSLKPVFRGNARWVMSRSTVGTTRKLRDGAGSYIWSPPVQAFTPSTLLQAPITEAEDMPAVGTDSYSVAYGDFKQGYQIVDRQSIRVLRDPFTDKPYVKFYATKRVGGGVVHYEAIKLLKFGTA